MHFPVIFSTISALLCVIIARDFMTATLFGDSDTLLVDQVTKPVTKMANTIFTESQLKRLEESMREVRAMKAQRRKEERLQVANALLRLREVVCREKLIVEEITIATGPDGSSFRIRADGTFYSEWAEYYGVMWDDNSATYEQKNISPDIESLCTLPMNITIEQVESIIEQLLA